MNQVLIFTPTTTVINVPIAIKDDSITEPTETFTSLLSLQSQLSNVTIQPAIAQVTILDDDPGEISVFHNIITINITSLYSSIGKSNNNLEDSQILGYTVECPSSININFLNYCDYVIAELNVVIGFLGSPYSTNESAGVLTVQVGVISGSLQTDVVFSLSTIDATAIGELFSMILYRVAMSTQ